jgi:hypothetical protein
MDVRRENGASSRPPRAVITDHVDRRQSANLDGDLGATMQSEDVVISHEGVMTGHRGIRGKGRNPGDLGRRRALPHPPTRLPRTSGIPALEVDTCVVKDGGVVGQTIHHSIEDAPGAEERPAVSARSCPALRRTGIPCS